MADVQALLGRIAGALGSSAAAGWVQAIGAIAALGVAILIPRLERIGGRREYRAAVFDTARFAVEELYNAFALAGDLEQRQHWAGELALEHIRFDHDPLAATDLPRLAQEEVAIVCLLKLRAHIDQARFLVREHDQISMKVILGEAEPYDLYLHAVMWNQIGEHYENARMVLSMLAELLLSGRRRRRARQVLRSRFPAFAPTEPPRLELEHVPGFVRRERTDAAPAKPIGPAALRAEPPPTPVYSDGWALLAKAPG
jgi:hypothetical protein